jgi:hypothetical protein
MVKSGYDLGLSAARMLYVHTANAELLDVSQ